MKRLLRPLAVGAALFAACSPKPPAPGGRPLAVASLTFPDGAAIQVEVADTPQEREYGLMNRNSLPQDYGMLFVFPSEQSLAFWMKNTWVDLDMVYLSKDKSVTRIFENVPRSAPFTPEANVATRMAVGQYVLELPAGAAARHHLAQGQTLSFSVPIPPK